MSEDRRRTNPELPDGSSPVRPVLYPYSNVTDVDDNVQNGAVQGGDGAEAAVGADNQGLTDDQPIGAHARLNHFATVQPRTPQPCDARR